MCLAVGQSMYSSLHRTYPALRVNRQQRTIPTRLRGYRGVSIALPRGVIVFITPDGFCDDKGAAVKLARDALEGGVGLVQIRDRLASLESLYAVTAALRSELGGCERFAVNGPHALSIARSNAGIGVHVRESRIVEDVPEACLTVCNGGVVGCSVHSVQAAVEAVRHGPPDYIQVGTMFETRSHPGKVPEGPDLLSRVREAVRPSCMLIGVGGITAGTAATVIEHGADGVAIISGIAAAADPAAAAANIKRKLQVSKVTE